VGGSIATLIRLVDSPSLSTLLALQKLDWQCNNPPACMITGSQLFIVCASRLQYEAIGPMGQQIDHPLGCFEPVR